MNPELRKVAESVVPSFGTWYKKEIERVVAVYYPEPVKSPEQVVRIIAFVVLGRAITELLSVKVTLEEILDTVRRGRAS